MEREVLHTKVALNLKPTRITFWKYCASANTPNAWKPEIHYLKKNCWQHNLLLVDVKRKGKDTNWWIYLQKKKGKKNTSVRSLVTDIWWTWSWFSLTEFKSTNTVFFQMLLKFFLLNINSKLLEGDNILAQPVRVKPYITEKVQMSNGIAQQLAVVGSYRSPVATFVLFPSFLGVSK